MARYYGYIRVSTEQQNLEGQKHKILDYAFHHKMKIEKFFEIEVSSRKEQKARLIDEVFEVLVSGDVLVVTELSRLGRNMLEILNLIEKFNYHEIQLVFINQPELSTKNTNNALSTLLLAIYGYFAQTERDIVSERTKQGLEAARKKGKILGRRKGQLVKSKYDPYKEKISELHSLGLSPQKIVNYIGVGTQPSLAHYIKTRLSAGT